LKTRQFSPKQLQIRFAMKPQKPRPAELSQFQLFQTRLDQLVDTTHELIQLADTIQWSRFDEAYEPLYCEDNGAPGLPTRLMVGLEYLKYAFKLSDEELVKRWVENPYWQYFCGEVFFQTEPPLHDTSLGKWRKRIGDERLKLILEETVRVAMAKKFLTEKDCEQVVADTTVQEKNITFPTDSKLLSRAIIKLAKFCCLNGIKLRQPYTRKAKEMARKASGYAAARQFKRLASSVQTLKNWLGRVLRDIERKSEGKILSCNFKNLITLANKLLVQEKDTKKKIYSLHEPEVCCIGKGKARIRYEFGQLAAIVKTNKGNWIVNVEDFSDNPYDGHTLAKSISGAEAITKVTVQEAAVDAGYRGHDYKGSAKILMSRTSSAGLSRSECKRKRRRSSIEPVIGHLKSDHRLGRCFLKGREGDKLNLIGSAAGFNIRKLLKLLALGNFPCACVVWGVWGRVFGAVRESLLALRLAGAIART
jgi:IS5 family transposase